MCDNMDEPWGHYARWSKPVTEGQINTVWFYSYEGSKIVEWWLPGAGGNGEMLFNEFKVSVMQDELSSRDLLYNAAPVVNNAISYT